MERWRQSGRFYGAHRIVDTAGDAAGIECGRIPLIERRVFRESLRQIGIGYRQFTKRDSVRDAIGQRGGGALEGEALIRDIDAAECVLDGGADGVGLTLFARTKEGQPAL